LAILKGTYRDPNTFPKNFNQISIGAPLIFTSDLLMTSTQTQPILTTIPQTGQSNFLQIFTPLQTIDQMGGLITNQTHLFEYPNQTGKRFFCFIFESRIFFYYSAFPILTTSTRDYEVIKRLKFFIDMICLNRCIKLFFLLLFRYTNK
jgi:hypothetical protein